MLLLIYRLTLGFLCLSFNRIMGTMHSECNNNGRQWPGWEFEMQDETKAKRKLHTNAADCRERLIAVLSLMRFPGDLDTPGVSWLELAHFRHIATILFGNIFAKPTAFCRSILCYPAYMQKKHGLKKDLQYLFKEL